MSRPRFIGVSRANVALALVSSFPRRMFASVSESRRGKVDAERLYHAFPDLRESPDLQRLARRRLASSYIEYTSEVSSEIMSISLPLGSYLWALCTLLAPTTILDLGSGFSSLVFRMWASQSPNRASVWSVDDSHDWLEKTRHFLEAHALPSEDLLTWDAFLKIADRPFDLVLHDLGSMEVRRNTLDKAIEMTRLGGVLLLDDVHKKAYRLAAERTLRERGLEYFSLWQSTRDGFGRFSFLVVK